MNYFNFFINNELFRTMCSFVIVVLTYIVVNDKKIKKVFIYSKFIFNAYPKKF